MPIAPGSTSSLTSLCTSEELLQTLLNVSLTGINLLRPIYATDGGELVDFANEYLNPAGQRIMGLPEQPGGTIRTRFTSTQGNEVFAFYRRVFESGEAGRYELNYQSDGIDNYFQLAAQRSGNALVVSFTDTSEQDRSAVEQALRESQAREQAARAEAELQRLRLHSVLMEAPAMICLFEGPQHVFKVVNPPYQRLVGERPLVGRAIAEAMPELAGQPIFELLDNVYRTGESFHAHEMLVQLDHNNSGQELGHNYYNFIYQATHNVQGEIDGILVFAYEVTAQVRARQQAEQLNEVLEKQVADRTGDVQAARDEAERQRHRLHKLFMEAPVPIAILDGPEMVFQLVNPAYQQIFLGRTLLSKSLLQGLPELKNSPIPDILSKVYSTGETFIAEELPLMLARSEGAQLEEVYWNFTYQARRDENGNVDGIFVFAYDVTPQVKARRILEDSEQKSKAWAQELAAANNDLSSANQLLTRSNVDLDNFIYTASHDLKVPILNIEGLMEALVDELPPESLQLPDVQRTVVFIAESVKRFKRTIEHLTEITKLQKENNPEASAVSLASVLEEIQLDLAPVIQAAQASIVVEVSSCPIMFFPQKNLRSILYNLISNALKYSCPERAPRVRVSCCKEHEYHVLSVEDNGLGMDLTQPHKLFDMFTRLHDHVEGSGIGLYMVKRIVENAGGKVEVESQLGEGTTFHVYIPQKADS